MAVLKAKEVKRMSREERNAKLQELRFELVKAGVTANKTNAKTKEIKRAIARLLTINKSQGENLSKGAGNKIPKAHKGELKNK
ncbi:MAG: 50S ribosomal protein L29 [Nanoarchaeota archaeon]|nr:50S ribosomal protein L29 [Nanoarchaeota archaeon]